MPLGRTAQQTVFRGEFLTLKNLVDLIHGPALQGSSRLEQFQPPQVAEIAWACVQSGAQLPLLVSSLTQLFECYSSFVLWQVKKCAVNVELKLEAYSGNLLAMLLEVCQLTFQEILHAHPFYPGFPYSIRHC